MRGERRATALRAGALGLGALALLALAIAGKAPSTAELRDFGDGLGAAAPLVWPPLFAVLNFVAPWPVLAGATGAVFGTAGGTPLALAGVLVAATCQFSLARRGAGPDLRDRALARMPGIDRALERDGLLALFLSRLVPGVPWGPVNYAAGLSKVRLRDVWVATVAGGTPKVFAYVALGGNLDDLTRPEAVVAIVIWAVMGIVGLTVAARRLRAR